MTTISTQQMAELETTARERTCRRLALHVEQHFPGSARLAGPGATLATGHRCLAQADELGLDSEADLLRLLSLQLFFGHGFRSDSLCGAFAAILERTDIATPRARVARAWREGMAHFEHIAGAAGEHQRAAVGRLAGRHLFALAADPSGLDGAQADTLMAWLWPQKHAAARALGTGALEASLWQVAALARAHGVARPGAARVLLVLGYVFGAGFGTDPMLPAFGGLAAALGAGADPRDAAAAMGRADGLLSRVAQGTPAGATAMTEDAS